MTTKRGSLSIAGAGKATGGIYERVTISGAGRVDGDIEADSVEISGAGKIVGKVKTNRVELAGACKIVGAVTAQRFDAAGAWKVGGDVQSEQFKAAGAGSVEGNVQAQEFSNAGAMKIAKNLRAQRAKFGGVLKAGGDVEASEFRGSGAFRIEGLLAADQLELELSERSWAREIGGAKIEVRKRESFWGWLARWWGRQIVLSADVIEADEIYLEATRAKTVRGKRVTLGPECRIERVEYSESVQIDPKSVVKEQVRL
ncbi:polymer-forming cytoskeletal protein [Candidatus Acetothermia bacterium]|jgi:cytoskeletal protein CcmA (bactofilin family)|nr:polymer-forming cytoskeletal protein [Candidatus Acetothermia bacterium]MCI2430956.1 polymer-forming cytoskeletal protein [Candidatus Acetothermia bacterium]MCI2437022.1 polymer-forming cytoskeletal protein [Candidatus Acetothermia bacterium]